MARVVPIVPDNGWGGIQLQVFLWTQFTRHTVPAIIALNRSPGGGPFSGHPGLVIAPADLQAVLKQIRPEVLFTHALNHTEQQHHRLARELGAQVVTFHHCAYPPRFQRHEVDCIITQSKANQKIIGWPDVPVVPLACRPLRSSCDWVEARKCRGIPLHSFVIGRIGRLEPIKCPEDAIRAAALMWKLGYNISLVIGGQLSIFYDQSYLSRLEMLAINQGVPVIFLGELTEQEKWDLLYSFDLCLYPTRDEGYCLSILEAMSAGLPVVTYDLPVLREVTDDLAAYAEPGNIDQLAAHSLKLISSNSRSGLMGDALQQLALERNEPGAIAEQIDFLLEETRLGHAIS